MEKSLIKPFIAKRVAQEFTDGMVVNLGIGLPVLCTSFLPEGIHVTVHSELGIVARAPLRMKRMPIPCISWMRAVPLPPSCSAARSATLPTASASFAAACGRCCPRRP